MLFKTNKTGSSENSVTPEPTENSVSKGRPTPKRKDAEAAAAARAKMGKDKTKAREFLRERRLAEQAKIKEGMRTGKEEYLMTRDKGPLRRFVRDWLDSRFMMIQFMLPLMFLIVILGLFPQQNIRAVNFFLQMLVYLFLIMDISWILFKLSREIKQRFPENTQPWKFYALSRALYPKRWRQPKPQVKWRQELPTNYR